MNERIKNRLFWSLIVLAGITAGLLFLGPKELLGTVENTEFVLKTLLYPTIFGIIILAWSKLDKKLNNRKPGEEG